MIDQYTYAQMVAFVEDQRHQEGDLDEIWSCLDEARGIAKRARMPELARLIRTVIADVEARQRRLADNIVEDTEHANALRRGLR